MCRYHSVTRTVKEKQSVWPEAGLASSVASLCQNEHLTTNITKIVFKKYIVSIEWRTMCLTLLYVRVSPDQTGENTTKPKARRFKLSSLSSADYVNHYITMTEQFRHWIQTLLDQQCNWSTNETIRCNLFSVYLTFIFEYWMQNIFIVILDREKKISADHLAYYISLRRSLQSEIYPVTDWYKWIRKLNYSCTQFWRTLLNRNWADFPCP